MMSHRAEKILNPETGRYVKSTSRKGREILKQYAAPRSRKIRSQIGGIQTDSEQDAKFTDAEEHALRFYHHPNSRSLIIGPNIVDIYKNYIRDFPDIPASDRLPYSDHLLRLVGFLDRFAPYLLDYRVNISEAQLRKLFDQITDMGYELDGGQEEFEDSLRKNGILDGLFMILASVLEPRLNYPADFPDVDLPRFLKDFFTQTEREYYLPKLADVTMAMAPLGLPAPQMMRILEERFPRIKSWPEHWKWSAATLPLKKHLQKIGYLEK